MMGCWPEWGPEIIKHLNSSGGGEGETPNKHLLSKNGKWCVFLFAVHRWSSVVLIDVRIFVDFFCFSAFKNRYFWHCERRWKWFFLFLRNRITKFVKLYPDEEPSYQNGQGAFSVNLPLVPPPLWLPLVKTWCARQSLICPDIHQSLTFNEMGSPDAEVFFFLLLINCFILVHLKH